MAGLKINFRRGAAMSNRSPIPYCLHCKEWLRPEQLVEHYPDTPGTEYLCALCFKRLPLASKRPSVLGHVRCPRCGSMASEQWRNATVDIGGSNTLTFFECGTRVLDFPLGLNHPHAVHHGSGCISTTLWDHITNSDGGP